MAKSPSSLQANLARKITSMSAQFSGRRPALSSCATYMFIEANVEVIVADVSSGADSIPKSSQAGRSAPADLPPMRFTWLPRADVNEPGTIGPRRV